MIKVCVPLTTRGNYAKARQFILAAQDSKYIEPITLLGGALLTTDGALVRDAIKRDRIHVSEVVDYVDGPKDLFGMTLSAANALKSFAEIFMRYKPDYVVVIADRYECLPIAIAASYQNIKLCHIEGGEVSGTIDEAIRHSVTKLSHLHFVANKDAAARVERLGETADSIIEVGATSLDAIGVFSKIDITEQVASLLLHKNLNLNKPFILVIQHPVTTEYNTNDFATEVLMEALDELGEQVLWVESNIDAGSDLINASLALRKRDKAAAKKIDFIKSLPIELYAPMLAKAVCFVGNSSSGIREAAFLGTPSVIVGTRQTGRSKAKNVLEVDVSKEDIVDAVTRQIKHGPYLPDYTYGKGDAYHLMINAIITDNSATQKKIAY